LPAEGTARSGPAGASGGKRSLEATGEVREKTKVKERTSGQGSLKRKRSNQTKSITCAAFGAGPDRQNRTKNVKRSRRGGRRPQHGGGGSGGGNNGGGFNPNRAYDSNGPEVKIRGTASHIYEKYLQLARDANSTGDRVMAENYLQHAEHYYRIVAATQAQLAQQQAQAAVHAAANGGNGQPNGQRPPGQGDQPQVAQAANPSFSLAEGATEEEGEDAEAS
jgi:hypothetical protein